MQTTLTTVWSDIYAEIGLLGIIVIITVYGMLAERGVLPKFWLKGRKIEQNNELVRELYKNHIPHIESRLDVIDNKIDNLDAKVDDVKKSAHARMDRIEKRLET